MNRALPHSLLMVFAFACCSHAQLSHTQPAFGQAVNAIPVSASSNYNKWFAETGNPGVAYNLQEQSGAAAGQAGASGGGQATASGGGDAVKQSQNPIASMVSLPFQNNWNFGIGPDDQTQYVGLLQPVFPLPLNKRWNLITRPILPLVNSPDGTVGREHGLGDMQWQNFFVPVPDQPSNLTWGIGPSFIMPTASSPDLGAQNWGVGVSGVAVYADGPIVGGALINQNFVEGGIAQPFFFQPFFNYNFSRGILNKFFISVSGEFQADWKKDGNQWNNVFGFGPGRGIKIFGQPMSISTRFAPYLDPAVNGPNWQFRLNIIALFPK